MNSFDVFDTLIARWYINDDEYKSTGDFYTELKHTYPILENVALLDNDSIIISDTYFTKEQVENLLHKNNITNYKDLFVSYDDKWTGKAWEKFRPDHHLGDNKTSDVDRPRSVGINATHYTGSFLTEVEQFIFDSGFKNIAALARAVRLSNPYSQNSTLYKIWNEQSQINVPLLILVSNHLSKLTQYDSFLFTYRDCINLIKVFKSLYPDINAEPFLTSRNMYNNPTPKFTDYVREKATSKSLIVDLQGTSISLRKLINYTDYFTVIYSDLEDTYPVQYLFHRASGFSDKIERLNYGLSIEKAEAVFRDGKPVDNNYYDIVMAQRHAVSRAVNFISSGFNVEREYSNSVLEYLLSTLEKNCVVSNYVNHEEM